MPPLNRVFHFPWGGWKKENWRFDIGYPTQAKVRLEWGTQRLLQVWQRTNAETQY
jgi:hypothetical protein